MKMTKTHWEDEFYEIHDSANGKVINIMGYFYGGCDGGYDHNREWNKDWSARNVSYCIEFMLDDFINRFVNGDEDWTDCEEYWNRMEYMEDMTDEMAEEQMENMIIENNYIGLPFSHLSMDTPCGCYIDADET